MSIDFIYIKFKLESIFNKIEKIKIFIFNKMSQIYILKIKNNKEEIKNRLFVVNAFSSKKADKLFYDKINKEGELIFDRIGNNYYENLREFINRNKLVLNHNIEYLLDFS